MALYTKEQLAHERSIGLELSDYDNEHFYDLPDDTVYHWSNEQFEQWLATKEWREDTKDYHRQLFKGVIMFNGNGGFSYE